MASKESLVLEFKKRGQFDAIRKRLLEEFMESVAGRKLVSRLRDEAQAAQAKSQVQLIATLTQSTAFNDAERDINIELLGAGSFREELKKQLKQTWESIKQPKRELSANNCNENTMEIDEPKSVQNS